MTNEIGKYKNADDGNMSCSTSPTNLYENNWKHENRWYAFMPIR